MTCKLIKSLLSERPRLKSSFTEGKNAFHVGLPSLINRSSALVDRNSMLDFLIMNHGNGTFWKPAVSKKDSIEQFKKISSRNDMEREEIGAGRWYLFLPALDQNGILRASLYDFPEISSEFLFKNAPTKLVICSYEDDIEWDIFCSLE